MEHCLLVSLRRFSFLLFLIPYIYYYRCVQNSSVLGFYTAIVSAVRYPIAFLSCGRLAARFGVSGGQMISGFGRKTFVYFSHEWWKTGKRGNGETGKRELGCTVFYCYYAANIWLLFFFLSLLRFTRPLGHGLALALALGPTSWQGWTARLPKRKKKNL